MIIIITPRVSIAWVFNSLFPDSIITHSVFPHLWVYLNSEVIWGKCKYTEEHKSQQDPSSKIKTAFGCSLRDSILELLICLAMVPSFVWAAHWGSSL